MRYIILILTLVLLFSCSGKKDSLISKYLNSNNIPAQKITIDVTRDTSLLLKGGTKLHIPKGTLITKNNQAAVLQLKEVLTAEQMLAAGMFTESDGKPLSSGGMIFIDADSSVDVQLVGQIVAEIPTKYVDERMQQFKGEKSDDGTINWTDPEPIQFNKADSAGIGKQLFMQNCASCHHPTKIATGPPLAGSFDRGPSREAVIEFVKNPAEGVLKYKYYCMEKMEFEVMMPAFPLLTNNEITAILSYADQQALNAEVSISSLRNPSYDSCEFYKAEANDLMNLKDSLLRNKKPFITYINYDSTGAITQPETGMGGKVEEMEEDADYYNVTIETFGWYNVDHFIEKAPESSLSVKLTGTFSDKTAIFLAIPSVKLMQQGGILTNGDSYGFYTEDGKIPLIQNADAYVFAIGESRDRPQLYYGATKFTTAPSQVIEINMNEISQEGLQSKLTNFNFTDFKAEVKPDSTKENVQSIDNRLMNLEQKLRICHCLSKMDSLSSDYALLRK